MPYDNEKADSPGKWLAHAEADIAMASIPLPSGARYEQLCFFAQQATEKSLKALLLFLGLDFPFTHNIQLLVSLLPSAIHSLPEFTDAEMLTTYAVLTRYPGEMEPVTKLQYVEALRIATVIVNWIKSYITTTNQ